MSNVHEKSRREGGAGDVQFDGVKVEFTEKWYMRRALMEILAKDTSEKGKNSICLEKLVSTKTKDRERRACFRKIVEVNTTVYE
jgi:hypothetical protein